MSISDDESLSWHETSGGMDYRAMPPPVPDSTTPQTGENSNLAKYAIGATVGAAAVLVLPTVVLIGAGVAAGAAVVKSDKMSSFYEKHTGRSSSADGSAVSNAVSATVSGAKVAGKTIVERIRKMSGSTKPKTPPGYSSFGERN